MKIVCEYCGKEARKSPRQVKTQNRHFCNRECYMNFKKKYPYVYQAREKDTTAFNKIKMLAELRKEAIEKNSHLLNKPKII